MHRDRPSERYLRPSPSLSPPPSLKPRIDEAIARAYRRARIEAAKETGLDEDTFPTACPYAFDDLMSRTFKR
jgi:hypothetical protein